jgi:hypothetical protein
MKRKVRRIHWYTAENEKTNDTEVMKDQMDRIFKGHDFKGLFKGHDFKGHFWGP